MPIRVVLLGLMLVIIAPSLFLVFDASRAQREQVIQSARANVHETVKYIDAQQRSRIQATRALVLGVSALPPVRDGDADTCSAFLKTFEPKLKADLKWEGFGEFVRVNAEGRTDCAAIDNRRDIDVRERPYYTEITKTGRMMMTDFLTSRVGNVPLLIIANPIFDDAGALKYILGVGLDTRWINGFLADSRPAEGDDVLMVDRRGTVIARFPDPLDKPIAPGGDLVKIAALADGSVHETTSLDGAPVLAAARRIAGTTISIVATSRLEPILRASQETFRQTFVTLLLIAGGALLLAWWLTHHLLLERIDRLTATARKIEGGDLDARTMIPHDNSEFGRLATTFDRMAERVEGDVAARTKELSESRDKLNQAQAIAHLGSWYWNIETGEEGWSDEQFRIFGHEPGAITPTYQSFVDALHPDDKERILAAVDGALRHDRPYDETFRIIDAKGVQRHLTALGKVERNADGEPTAMVGVVLDITERTRIEQAHRAVADLNQRIIDLSPVGIGTFDHHGRLVSANDALATLLGMERGDLVGTTIQEIAPLSASGLERHAEAAITSDHVVQTEITGTARTGRSFSADAYLVPFGIEGERHLLAMMNDLSERKEMEAQLVHAAKMATLGEMATGMAHELNQPLSVIRLTAATLERQIERGVLDAGSLNEKVQRITAGVTRASDLINHMRVFGRKSEDKPRAFAVADAVTGALDLLREQLRASGIEVRLSDASTDARVIGHSLLLEQVILNLVVNARDAIRQGGASESGRIEISIERVGPHARIVVADNGGGIPSAVMTRIFEPFFTTKAASQGTGLGLSISFGIIRDMGGTIAVANEGDGARFTIDLPAADPTEAGAKA